MSIDTKSLSADILLKTGISELNEMQQAAIEHGTKGKHLMLVAPTGSGKTLAFLSVVLNRLYRGVNGVTALVIVPSRELSIQIEEVFRSLKTEFKVTCCYGGHAFKIEQQSLTEAPAIIIGTPGRVVDHINRNSTDLSQVDIIVLDEFDTLLQMGFEEQMETIFSSINGKPQVILTSATSIRDVPEFIKLDRFETIDFSTEHKSKLKLFQVRTPKDMKTERLSELLCQFDQEPALVFCNHREAVERVSNFLKKENIEHGIFHGEMEQIDREKSLIKFRSGAHNVLIATDLAARGLDIPVIKHVVHFQYPIHLIEFLHRNGRTARMHADGAAYLILSDQESEPSYIEDTLEDYVLNKEIRSNRLPNYACLYVSAGKKDKISKSDILGYLTQTLGIAGSDIGLISVLDRSSYVAISRSQLDWALQNINAPKIKKMRVKIELAS